MDKIELSKFYELRNHMVVMLYLADYWNMDENDAVKQIINELHKKGIEKILEPQEFDKSEIKNSYSSYEEYVNEYEQNFSKIYLEYQNELLSYDLSDISSDRWGKFALFANGELDLSETKGNFDFSFIDVLSNDEKTTTLTAKNCNIRNLYKLNTNNDDTILFNYINLKKENFDINVVENNKEAFFLDDLTDNLRDLLTGGFTISDITIDDLNKLNIEDVNVLTNHPIFNKMFEKNDKDYLSKDALNIFFNNNSEGIYKYLFENDKEALSSIINDVEPEILENKLKESNGNVSAFQEKIQDYLIESLFFRDVSNNIYQYKSHWEISKNGRQKIDKYSNIEFFNKININKENLNEDLKLKIENGKLRIEDFINYPDVLNNPLYLLYIHDTRINEFLEKYIHESHYLGEDIEKYEELNSHNLQKDWNEFIYRCKNYEKIKETYIKQKELYELLNENSKWGFKAANSPTIDDIFTRFDFDRWDYERPNYRYKLSLESTNKLIEFYKRVQKEYNDKDENKKRRANNSKMEATETLIGNYLYNKTGKNNFSDIYVSNFINIIETSFKSNLDFDFINNFIEKIDREPEFNEIITRDDFSSRVEFFLNYKDASNRMKNIWYNPFERILLDALVEIDLNDPVSKKKYTDFIDKIIELKDLDSYFRKTTGTFLERSMKRDESLFNTQVLEKYEDFKNYIKQFIRDDIDISLYDKFDGYFDRDYFDGKEITKTDIINYFSAAKYMKNFDMDKLNGYSWILVQFYENMILNDENLELYNHTDYQKKLAEFIPQFEKKLNEKNFNFGSSITRSMWELIKSKINNKSFFDENFDDDALIKFCYPFEKIISSKNLNSFFDKKVCEYVDKELLTGNYKNNNVDAQSFINLINRLEFSNSSEIRRLHKELFDVLIDLDEKEWIEKLEGIEDIFLKNNLPYVGKVFKVFETLNDVADIRDDGNFFGYNMNIVQSPNLNATKSKMARRAIIFSDLIKCSLGSNNRSMRDYISSIEDGNQVLKQFLAIKGDFYALSNEDQETLVNYLFHLCTLYNNTYEGEKNPKKLTGVVLQDTYDLLSGFLKKEDDFNLDELPDRIIKMFGHFAGINTVEELKEYASNKISTADQRNRERAQEGYFKIREGDYYKGLVNQNGDEYDRYYTFLLNILQDGSVCKEFLGSDARSDTTPLDTDLSRIENYISSFSEPFKDHHYAAARYGPLWLVIKDDDRLNYSRETGKYMPDKLEIFDTNCDGDGHYGIRTGFASSDIDFFVVDEENLKLERIEYAIVMNGFYIPIVNTEGKVIFTPEKYDELAKEVRGLKYYGKGDTYDFAEELDDFDISKENYDINIQSTQEEVEEKRNLFINKLAESGLRISTKRRFNLGDGVIELLDTGSTGRGTNSSENYDYDFIMRIDRDIYCNPDKMEEFRNKIKDAFPSIEFLDDNKIRNQTVNIDGKEIKIDISILMKDDKIKYTTDESINDRLNTIKKLDKEKYEKVIENIVLAKEVLKEAHAYKPRHARENPEGGLGGVGIENWILKNGGSFEKAAKTFVEAADKSSNFSEFKKNYIVFDFGENQMYYRNIDQYMHGNFVESCMNEVGYENTVNALKKYLNELDNRKKEEKVL